MQYGPDLNSVLQHELFVMTDRLHELLKKKKKNIAGRGGQCPSMKRY